MNVENNNTAEAVCDRAASGSIFTIHSGLGDEDEDVHKCGRCQLEFTSLESFIQHKLRNNCQRGQDAVPVIQADESSQENSPVVLSDEITVAAILVDESNRLLEEAKSSSDPGTKTKTDDHSGDQLSQHGDDGNDEEHKEEEQDSQGTALKAKLRTNEHGRFLCQLCDKTFKTGNILRAHLSTHSEKKNFRCELCGNAFRTKGSLIRHNRRHTDERPYRCSLCGLCFRESGALTRHLKSITPCTEKIRFHQCKEILVSKNSIQKVSSDAELDSSVYRLRPAEEQPSVVEVVPAEEHHVEQEVHMQMELENTGHTEQITTSESNGQSSHSETDGSSLINQAIISSEIGAEEEEDDDDDDVDDIDDEDEGEITDGERMEDIQVTEECVEVGSEEMETSSRESDSKSYACPHCSRVFSGPSYLRLHIKGHLGYKPFKCQECDKEFITGYLLKKHMEAHMSERRFKCGECGKLYKTIGHVREHMRVHSDERPYSCHKCGKGYKTKNALQVHLRTHFDEKPYVCQFCFRGFREKGSLVRHIRHHTGEKPFKCFKCGRGFAEHGTLNRHLRAKGGCFAGTKESEPAEVSEEDNTADSIAATIISEDPHTVLVEFSSVVADTQEYIIEAPGESAAGVEETELIHDDQQQVGSHIMKVVQQIVNQASSGHQIIVQNLTVDENTDVAEDGGDTITIATPESLTEQVAMTLASAIGEGTILTTEGNLEATEGTVTMLASQDIEVMEHAEEYVIATPEEVEIQTVIV
ncbi:transcription factor E4F1 isoform X2 [Polypterus senegalus]|uniref:transcription factor E4F1 isoform X2 n=1 Tax=Polypterus senegalus TaxID=55291 RepID=UPI0019658825|nr:transcription factor E4F1 isoform X2 [Polypterus senegalus]